MSGSLISAIMPTANRRMFIPRAIAYFLAQEYGNKELVILDDGTESIADLVPSHPCIRYIRFEVQQSLGAKRNQLVAEARGNLILHWDDDDWHAPWRMGYQVDALTTHNAEICGLRRMLFHNPASGETWLYDYPAEARSWLAGGSLLYTRAFWQRAPFPEIQVGEDSRFVWAQQMDRAIALDDFRFYVATIHAGNTSPKHCNGPYWMRWPGDISSVFEPRKTTRMQLNLGCCDAPLPGYVNVDLIPGPGVDQVADLRERWPWPESSAAFVRAWDVIEHLPDKVFTMNELWRVLSPGGRAEIAVPTTDGTGAFQDPTHVSFWNRRSFLYYEAGNPYRERFFRHYGIQAKFRVLTERIDGSVDGPRLTIVLEAVKP